MRAGRRMRRRGRWISEVMWVGKEGKDGDE